MEALHDKKLIEYEEIILVNFCLCEIKKIYMQE